MRACKVAQFKVRIVLSVPDLANTGSFGPCIQSKVRLSPLRCAIWLGESV